MKDLPADQRPREKLLARGAPALADAELLALLLRTGYKGQGVLALAGAVIEKFNGYAGLLHATPAELQSIKGLGPAKRAELLAVIEMARRALAEQLQAKPVFDTPQRVKLSLLHELGDPDEAYAVGDVVQFPTPDGEGRYAGVVREVGADWLLFDFNHPLAGQPVRFEVQVLGVL